MTREEYKKEIFGEPSSTKVYKSAKKYIKSLEAQLKAKDKRIVELEKNNTNLINDVIVLDNDLHRFLSIERKKTCSIVAMLFWEWRKDKRIYENANKYTKETAELYVNCSELSFKKAYAMLKGKQMSEDMKWRIELTKNMGMAFGMGVVVFDICERFSPYIFINLGKYALSIGRFQ